MCMFCASIPAAAAVGAKLNSDQKKKQAAGQTEPEKPIAAITTGVVVLLVLGSAVYHTTTFS